jgi:hypothetical protein
MYIFSFRKINHSGAQQHAIDPLSTPHKVSERPKQPSRRVEHNHKQTAA